MLTEDYRHGITVARKRDVIALSLGSILHKKQKLTAFFLTQKKKQNPVKPLFF